MAPVKVGPCRGYFPRWHYNGASERCEEFPYGGCKANLNNYLTMEECTNACDGAGEVCGALCTEEQFTCTNGCCLDPGLECDTKAQCSDKSDEDEEYCKYLEKKFNLLLLIPVDEKKARCTESPLAGDCRNSVTKWYYNPLQKNCVRFNYGGCNGNDNRFDTNDDCMGMCRGVTEEDIFARKEAFEKSMSDSNTGVLAVAILLGLAIFVLLGVLCYCFLKGKKKKPQQQRVATNGTQVTSIEDRERLVYNNTTKAI
ncbi:hypothetical protein NHX12_019694 [Muraenolepis orangiensis]|uniref:BPTI/Kunitz inhibitor domain-containing protein n=1 Tax=Muraenolepis orangiensis TaxID=630683 RepID=A0A9Q0EX52_9TELE|nr:hypothetical protein NHX12_019694 [Muraenolepis orangiensis]